MPQPLLVGILNDVYIYTSSAVNVTSQILRNENDCEVYMKLMYKHVESELHQTLSLKVSRLRKTSLDRIKNRLEDTPFDEGTC